MARLLRHQLFCFGNFCHCSSLWILLFVLEFRPVVVAAANFVHDTTIEPITMSFEEWLLLHKPEQTNSTGSVFYPTEQEFSKRRNIYYDNISRWNKLNRIPGGARFGPDTETYADRTPNEFANIVGSCYRSRKFLLAKDHPTTTNRDSTTVSQTSKHLSSPKEPFTIMDIDWREHAAQDSLQPISYVTPVKNQGPHGTCWSFAAAENLEGLAVRQGHTLQNISEQEFISCCSDCQGASADHTFQWLKDATDGVPALEASYPYIGNITVPCRAETAPRANVQLHTWGRVQDETGHAILAALKRHGPMGMGVDARCFHGYQSGIVRECRSDPAPSVNHAVLMVAAGTDLYYSHDRSISFPTPVDFFAIKNSWGKAWGEDGYVRIERGKNWWGPLSVIYTE